MKSIEKHLNDVYCSTKSKRNLKTFRCFGLAITLNWATYKKISEKTGRHSKCKAQKQKIFIGGRNKVFEDFSQKWRKRQQYLIHSQKICYRWLKIKWSSRNCQHKVNQQVLHHPRLICFPHWYSFYVFDSHFSGRTLESFIHFKEDWAKEKLKSVLN